MVVARPIAHIHQGFCEDHGALEGGAAASENPPFSRRGCLPGLPGAGPSYPHGSVGCGSHLPSQHAESGAQ